MTVHFMNRPTICFRRHVRIVAYFLCTELCVMLFRYLQNLFFTANWTQKQHLKGYGSFLKYLPDNKMPIPDLLSFYPPFQN